MKKFMLIGALIVVVAAVFGFAAFAYAQTPNPPGPQTPFGRGMMGGGRMGPGMMGGLRGADGYGPMHEYMEAALAEALNMDVEDLEAALAEGKTMWQVAEEKGLTAEEIQAVMVEAQEQALAKMVTDKVITQEQADWMQSRMQGMWGQGGSFGSRGGCPGMGGGFGGRWGGPTTSPTTGTGF